MVVQGSVSGKNKNFPLKFVIRKYFSNLNFSPDRNSLTADINEKAVSIERTPSQYCAFCVRELYSTYIW